MYKSSSAPKSDSDAGRHDAKRNRLSGDRAEQTERPAVGLPVQGTTYSPKCFQQVQEIAALIDLKSIGRNGLVSLAEIAFAFACLDEYGIYSYLCRKDRLAIKRHYTLNTLSLQPLAHTTKILAEEDNSILNVT
jgi:hypothetical protein